MSDQQKRDHRDLYVQLRLNLIMPGEEIAGQRRPYTPVNRDDMTWEMAMAEPDVPPLGKLFWFALGRFEQPKAGRAVA